MTMRNSLNGGNAAQEKILPRSSMRDYVRSSTQLSLVRTVVHLVHFLNHSVKTVCLFVYSPSTEPLTQNPIPAPRYYSVCKTNTQAGRKCRGKTKLVAKWKEANPRDASHANHPDDILGKGKSGISGQEGLEMGGGQLHKAWEFGGDRNHDYDVLIHLCITQNTQNVRYFNLALQWQVSFLPSFFHPFSRD